MHLACCWEIGVSWGLSPNFFCHKGQEIQKTFLLSLSRLLLFFVAYRHENVIQDRNIRHENVIVGGVIRHENVMSPCASSNIFAIIRVRRGNYAERLLRADCAMERQAE